MIKITKLADYGIVLLASFARDPAGRSYTARSLAMEAHIPLPTVNKVLRLAAKHGLLVSQRGARGGYRLALPPGEISLARIIRALEGPVGVTECTQGPGICFHEMLCPIRSNWYWINRAILETLEKVSLAEMVYLQPRYLPASDGQRDRGPLEEVVRRS